MALMPDQKMTRRRQIGGSVSEMIGKTFQSLGSQQNIARFGKVLRYLFG
jgi:hypothetical protein